MKKKQQKFQLSVIIPTRNRLDVLPDMLTALEHQDCPMSEFEVIVVDDESSDGSFKYLTEKIKNTALNLKIFIGEGKSASAARNLGVSKSCGEILLFLDVDTIPDFDVVGLHLNRHNQYIYRHSVVVGRVKMSGQLDRLQQARLWDTRLPINEEKNQDLDWVLYRTANTSMARKSFESIGGFNESLVAAEDTELAYRLSQDGTSFFYDSKITTIHHHPMNLKSYLEKGKMYGQAVCRWYAQNPELRPLLSLRYGVAVSETKLQYKIRWFFRVILVNPLTIYFIIKTGQLIRNFSLITSDTLYKIAFRYYTRVAFRSEQKNLKGLT